MRTIVLSILLIPFSIRANMTLIGSRSSSASRILLPSSSISWFFATHNSRVASFKQKYRDKTATYLALKLNVYLVSLSHRFFFNVTTHNMFSVFTTSFLCSSSKRNHKLINAYARRMSQGDVSGLLRSPFISSMWLLLMWNIKKNKKKSELNGMLLEYLMLNFFLSPLLVRSQIAIVYFLIIVSCRHPSDRFLLVFHLYARWMILNDPLSRSLSRQNKNSQSESRNLRLFLLFLVHIFALCSSLIILWFDGNTAR